MLSASIEKSSAKLLIPPGWFCSCKTGWSVTDLACVHPSESRGGCWGKLSIPRCWVWMCQWTRKMFILQALLGLITLWAGVPVVPHKAVAEVSKISNYRRGELLWIMDGRANPRMDWKVVGVSGHVSVYLPVYLLSIFLSVCLSICLSISLAICLSIFFLFIYVSTYLSIWFFFHLSICLSVYLYAYLSVYLSICLSLGKSSWQTWKSAAPKWNPFQEISAQT